MKKYIAISFAILLLTFVLSGCESKGTGPGVNNDANYAVYGAFIQNVNQELGTDYSDVPVQIFKNSNKLTTAVTSFNSIPMVYSLHSNIDDSVYNYSITPISYIDSGTYSLNFADSSVFAGSVPVTVIDSFIFDNPPDTSVPNTNGTSIEYSWLSAANIHGYVIAVVLDGREYTENGYSSYVTSLSTSVTVPPDAFRVNQFNALDTGWYHIYIYGYTGSPDSALTSKLLPVPFPSQLADNVSLTNIEGRFGSITVARKTMLHVVSQ
ncbi:MAG: hypothetical protein DWP97_08415 [Calditrichaeota bacterium]|nr:MAG: hypothetical protein DWP97_08415 [Calditrichota bacterium]